MNNDKFNEWIERLSKTDPYSIGYGRDYHEIKEKLEILKSR